MPEDLKKKPTAVKTTSGPTLDFSTRTGAGVIRVDGGWADGKIVGILLDPADAARLDGQGGIVPNFDPIPPKKRDG